VKPSMLGLCVIYPLNLCDNVHHLEGGFKMTRFLLFVILLLSACAPSPSTVETAIAQKQLAWTPTPVPTSVSTPTASPWNLCILGKTMTPQYFDQVRALNAFNVNKNICIYGVITKKDEIDTGDVMYNIFPLDKPITFLVTARKEGIFTTADVGDCIVVIGYPYRSEDDAPQFVSLEVTDIPQLTSKLGMSNLTVQEITSLCK